LAEQAQTAVNALLGKELPVIGVTIGRLVAAIVVFIIGVIVVRIVRRLVQRSLERVKAPAILISALTSLVSALLWIAVILATLAALGVNTGSVVLGLSAILGLILGFGLQDTIANLAAGVWLAIYRPFDIGDAVELEGRVGVVKDLKIMGVELATFDNVYIFIPSKKVWGSTIVNYSRYPIRRVDLDVGVAYGTDLDKAARVLLETAKNNPLVKSEPAPQVVVKELGDSAILLQLRAWVDKENYAAAKSQLTKAVYESLTKAGIEIPFPQLDVHIRDMPK